MKIDEISEPPMQNRKKQIADANKCNAKLRQIANSSTKFFKQVKPIQNGQNISVHQKAIANASKASENANKSSVNK